MALGGICTIAAAQGPASQADPRRFSIVGMTAVNLANALGSASAARGEMRLFERDLDAARAQFWSLYPNGPGLDSASARLAALLFAKDRYYLNLVAARRADPSGRPDRLMTMMVGEVDGSIPDAAAPAFHAWVDAVLASTTERVAGRPLITAAAIGSPRSSAAYRAYVSIRDFAEFLRGPLSPLFSKEPGLFLTGILMNGLKLTAWEAAEAQYAVVRDVLGTNTPQVAAQLQSAVTPLAVRRAIQLYVFGRITPVDYLWEQAVVLERNAPDDRRFLLLAIGRVEENRDFVVAKQRYDGLVKEYGEKLVLQLAGLLRLRARLKPLCQTQSYEVYARCVHELLRGGSAAIADAVEDAKEENERAAASVRAAQLDSAAKEDNAYWEAEAQKGGVPPGWPTRNWVFQQRLRRVPNWGDYTPVLVPVENAFGYFFMPDDMRRAESRRTEAGDASALAELEKAIGSARASCEESIKQRSNPRGAPCLILKIAEDLRRDLPPRR